MSSATKAAGRKVSDSPLRRTRPHNRLTRWLMANRVQPVGPETSESATVPNAFAALLLHISRHNQPATSPLPRMDPKATPPPISSASSSLVSAKSPLSPRSLATRRTGPLAKTPRPCGMTQALRRRTGRAWMTRSY